MGTSYNVYIGPAFKVKASAFNFTAKETLRSCPNPSCSEFKNDRHRYASVTVNFCPKCGQQLVNVELEIKRSPQGALYDKFQDVYSLLNGEESKPKHFYFVNNVQNIFGRRIEPKYDEVEDEIDEAFLKDAKQAFMYDGESSAMKPLYDWLCSSAGEDNVKYVFCYKTYTS